MFLEIIGMIKFNIILVTNKDKVYCFGSNRNGVY